MGIFLLSLFMISYYNLSIHYLTFHNIIIIIISAIKESLAFAFLNSLIIAPIFYYLLPKFKIIRIYFLKTNE